MTCREQTRLPLEGGPVQLLICTLEAGHKDSWHYDATFSYSWRIPKNR